MDFTSQILTLLRNTVIIFTDEQTGKNMKKENFLINELAQRAGTTVRTIRYYTNEGLLPQPDIQGKYAYYSQQHLNRLELIRRMKDAYLPLREIRQIIVSLSDEEVAQRLMEQIPSNQESEPGLKRNHVDSDEQSNALEYISKLMNEQNVLRSTSASTPPQFSQPVKRSAPAPANLQVSNANYALVEGETWQHIQLAPGIELNLLLPVDSDTNSRIQQLIAFASKLFR
jgi:DNA-binding transcriptional MerR regulator